ncbi:ABC transporter ATP-binding protein [uncultured Kordia sp.]|uniref:ABC transporter ATP-binding protein n=1 Tax=uncultured Kordia sp. TaxID=507699 RepID=UPI0026101F13|nr:ABC transporter ATP-binding protein [uncultured Kordia sp.]
MEKDIILQVEELSKQYRLGVIGTGTITHDLNRWWHKIRGKEDPYQKIGDKNARTEIGTSNYVWALKDISFDLEKGEVLGVIGRNGAGKSTLLKLLSKVTTPTKGVIRSKGRIASLLEVGTGFHPELTGRENIYLNGAILGMTKAEIKVKFDEIVEFAGVQRYINTPVKRYSSGMKVRLAFAVAAHLEPEILIVDEVLAVGDVEFQKKAIGKMQDISHGDGRTVLFVSHNMMTIRRLCSRAILLEDGMVSYAGDVESTINKYIEKNTVIKETDIATRTERLGSGQARITNAVILSSEIKTGAPFEVELSYKNNSNFEIDEFGISIWKLDETKIISISSNLKKEIATIDQNTGKVRCKIDSLPLVQGSYLLNVFVANKAGVADYLEKVLTFEVEENDYFGNGKLVDSKWGTIIVDHKWKHTNK